MLEAAFQEVKAKLMKQVKFLQQKGPEGLNKHEHPFFGPRSIQDRETIWVKHLDHRLRQIGV